MSILRWVGWSRSAMFALLIAITVSAGMTTSGFASCTTDPAAAQKAASFIGNPSSLLSGSNGPRAAVEITNDVRDFVAANPQALAAVIAILKGSGLTADQQKAIGAGLGLAAGVCLRPDPTFAAEIQTELAGTDSTDAKTEFASITGNNPIRAVANGGIGGGPGSTGSVGGQTSPFGTTAGSSSFQTFTSNSVSNNPTNYFGGSAGGISFTGGTTTTTTTTNTLVCTVSSTCP